MPPCYGTIPVDKDGGFLQPRFHNDEGKTLVDGRLAEDRCGLVGVDLVLNRDKPKGMNPVLNGIGDVDPTTSYEHEFKVTFVSLQKAVKVADQQRGVLPFVLSSRVKDKGAVDTVSRSKPLGISLERGIEPDPDHVLGFAVKSIKPVSG